MQIELACGVRRGRCDQIFTTQQDYLNPRYGFVGILKIQDLSQKREPGLSGIRLHSQHDDERFSLMDQVATGGTRTPGRRWRRLSETTSAPPDNTDKPHPFCRTLPGFGRAKTAPDKAGSENQASPERPEPPRTREQNPQYCVCAKVFDSATTGKGRACSRMASLEKNSAHPDTAPARVWTPAHRKNRSSIQVDQIQGGSWA